MKKTNIVRLMATFLLGGLLIFNFLALHSEKGTTVHSKLKRGSTKTMCVCMADQCVIVLFGMQACLNVTPCDGPCDSPF